MQKNGIVAQGRVNYRRYADDSFEFPHKGSDPLCGCWSNESFCQVKTEDILLLHRYSVTVLKKNPAPHHLIKVDGAGLLCVG